MMTNTAHRGVTISNAEFARMWLDPQVPARDIADRLNISVSAVHQRAVARNLPARLGGGGMNRKIDPMMFRAMWSANVGVTDIANYFGVSRPCVNLRARQWGFPPRKCNRWNSVPMLAFLMRRAAAQEQAAMINAEMADKRRDNRMVGSEHARAAS